MTTAQPSIRGRLSRALVAMTLAWGLAVTLAVWFVVRHEVDELLDATLRESAEIIDGLLLAGLDETVARYGAAGVMPASPHDEHLVWQLVDETVHRVVLRSHRAPDAPLLAERTVGFVDAGERWRVYGIALPAPDVRMLYVAQDGIERQEARLDAGQFTAGAALLVGLLSVFWLRWRVRRELATLGEMSAAIAVYDPLGQSTDDLPPASRSELVPMRAAVTGLGARLARRLHSERAFTAHAAHALRTPLAGIDAQLALAMRECPAALQPRLQRTRDAARRLQRVVAALLTLFRTGSDPTPQSLDLDDLVTHLPFGTLRIGVGHSIPFRADPDLLVAALLNLIDNAVRHEATEVTLSARASDVAAAVVVVRVEDNGRGLSAARRTELQRGLDSQEYAGLPGLGLMLADMVARAHSGRLHLVEVSTGCAVELELRDSRSAQESGSKKALEC